VATVFLTGFPGFLGSALVERLLERYPADTTVSCLVQSKYRAVAERRAADIESRDPAWSDRIRLYEGDITVPGLGIEDPSALQSEVREVYHLAAVYDLGVSLALGIRVNVEGTTNVLDFAEGCPDLERFQYVSTCYVSGRYDGTFTESDLDVGQSFNNYYEATKYLAEVEVQRRMRRGLPVTIYRPAIAVGDSRTGETQKYDGPYYVVRWLLRQPGPAVVSTAGDPADYEINVVPRDFVVDAIAHLSGLDASAGRVYQLADPDPPTVDEMLTVLERATDRRVLRVPTPTWLLKGVLEHVPGANRVMQIEPEALDYFSQPTHYACENTLADLADTEIACPPFSAYADRLVAFVREHPEISADAMV